MKKNEIKILCLGSAGTGKSTICKQMILKERGTFTPTERQECRDDIFTSLIASMICILDMMVEKKINLSRLENARHVRVLRSISPDLHGRSLPPDITTAILDLWSDESVKKAARLCHISHLGDSFEYFFDEVRRIGTLDYVPNDSDVLRARVKSVGIKEIVFELDTKISKVPLKFLDVGGQRSERKKWIGMFEAVDAIIFVASLSSYDEVLAEDNSVNSLKETVQIWDSIANSQWFTRSTIMLLLNKTDLFGQKLRNMPLSSKFPEYTGPNEPKEAAHFIRTLFEKRIQSKKKVIVRYTCAIDTKTIGLVLTNMTDLLLKKHFREAGIMN